MTKGAGRDRTGSEHVHGLICRREARDHLVKLAVSHALAQSSKLLVYEGRVWELVERVRQALIYI